MGSHGRSTNFSKTATLANFDGSSGAKTLFIQPGSAIAGIDASIAANATPGADIFVAVRLKLQYWVGSIPSGTGWDITGGAWTTFWQTTLGVSNGTTNLAGAGFDRVFRPAMEIPAPFKSSVLAGATHAKTGQFIAPNTHAAVEVANEWDIRAFFTVIAGAGAGFDADVNIQTSRESL